MTSDFKDREQRLNEVIAAYFEKVESGEAVELDQLIADHSELRTELTEFFAGREHLERITRPLRAVA